MTPFDLVYNALWEMVRSHCLADDLIKPGNCIDFSTADPMKGRISAADLPELILVQDTQTINLHSTSSTTTLVKEYSWLVSTGDYRIADKLHKVEWLLTLANLNWKSVLPALEWQGKRFVTLLEIVNCKSGIADPQQNRNIAGWSAVWAIRVRMDFRTLDLLAICGNFLLLEDGSPMLLEDGSNLLLEV